MKSLLLLVLLCAGCSDGDRTNRPYVISQSQQREETVVEIEPDLEELQ